MSHRIHLGLIVMLIVGLVAGTAGMGLAQQTDSGAHAGAGSVYQKRDQGGTPLCHDGLVVYHGQGQGRYTVGTQTYVGPVEIEVTKDEDNAPSVPGNPLDPTDNPDLTDGGYVDDWGFKIDHQNSQGTFPGRDADTGACDGLLGEPYTMQARITGENDAGDEVACHYESADSPSGTASNWERRELTVTTEMHGECTVTEAGSTGTAVFQENCVIQYAALADPPPPQVIMADHDCMAQPT